MAKNRDYAAEAQRLWERARDQLIQTLQPGNPRAFAQGINRSSLNHRSPYSNPNQGLSFASGRMPTPAEITAFAQQQPEYRRAIARLRNSGGSGGGQSSGGGGAASGAAGAPGAPLQPSAQMVAYNNWLQQQQEGYDESKAANEGRYNEGKGELTGTRDFRQEKYANFGEAAQQDIESDMQEALSNARANAAARGLSNSNVTDAYALRAARNATREKQRVREMRDSRMADAYAQDTGNLVGFIERREDPYPDMNQAMQIGIQLAGSEADRQASADRLAAMERMYRGAGDRGRSDYSLPPIPGPQGGVSPIFLNGTPVQQAQMMLGNRGPMLAYTSNRYPTRRGPRDAPAAAVTQPVLSPPVSLPGRLPEGWTGNATMQPTLAPPPRPPQYLPPNWTGQSTMAPTPINTYFGF